MPAHSQLQPGLQPLVALTPSTQGGAPRYAANGRCHAAGRLLARDRGERVVWPADADGLGPERQAVVRRGGFGFREGPVERGDGRGTARVLPGLDGELLGTGTPLSFSATAKVSMSSSMTFGRPPWLPLDAAMTWPSRVFSRMCPRGGSIRMHTDSRSTQRNGVARAGNTLVGEKPLVIMVRVPLVMERRKPLSGIE